MKIQKHPQKIIIDATSLTGKMSGIGHNTLQLIKALQEIQKDNNKYEIILLMPFDKVSDINKNGLIGIEYRAIPLPLVIYNILWKLRLLPPLDLIYGRGVYVFPNFKNTPLLFSKSITFIHDVSFLRYPQFTEPRNLKYLKTNIHRWAKRSTMVATLSKSSKNDLQKFLGIDESKVIIIPCGVDSKIFYHRTDSEINDIKKKYKIEGDYIFYLGNIEPRKNLIKLLEAYDLVIKVFPNLELVIIGGDGWLNESVNEKIGEIIRAGGKIIRPDVYVPDSDLPAIYSGALALVHPALYEGFGISPLQAMSCGTPVIVGHNSSIPEVLGDVGIYVDTASAESISNAIASLYSDKKRLTSMRAKGYERAKLFTWAASVQNLLDAIKEIS